MSTPRQERGYQYVVVRYRPDPVREEFVNVGIMVHDLATGDGHMRHATDFAKVRALDPNCSLDGIDLMLNVLKGGISLSTREDGLWAGVVHAPHSSASAMSMIYYSDVRGGVRPRGQTVEQLIQELFDTFVA